MAHIETEKHAVPETQAKIREGRTTKVEDDA